MSLNHVSLALDAPGDVTATERLILVLLAQYADADGMAAPSFSRIASQANVSPSTVTRSLRRLRDLGLIHRVISDGSTAPAWRLMLGRSARVGTEEGQA